MRYLPLSELNGKIQRTDPTSIPEIVHVLDQEELEANKQCLDERFEAGKIALLVSGYADYDNYTAACVHLVQVVGQSDQIEGGLHGKGWVFITDLPEEDFRNGLREYDTRTFGKLLFDLPRDIKFVAYLKNGLPDEQDAFRCISYALAQVHD